MTDSWQPLGVRQGWRAADSMADGVPDWMSGPIWNWIKRLIREIPSPSRYDVVEQLGLQLHLALEGTNSPEEQVARAVRRTTDADELRTLEVIDWLLNMHASVGVPQWEHESAWMPDAPARLEYVLSGGGSRWRVSSDGAQLQDRVDPTVVAAADLAIAAAERDVPSAAQHLRTAWAAMYGRNPNHREAVNEAIRAVEASAKPVVTGKDRGTLSDVLRDLDKDGRWALPMPLEWGPGPTVTDPGPVLAGMVKIVWHGQGERHGSPTSTTPVSAGQAETIVTTAVALVHLFAADLVQAAGAAP